MCIQNLLISLLLLLRVSRAQWNTWISEAKTEVPSWEARTQNPDSTTGGSCHVDQPTENVANISSPTDFKDLHTPPSLKKLDRYLDVVDFPETDSEHLQSPRETENLNILPSEENSVRERQKDVSTNLVEQPERSYTREIGKSKNWVASDNSLPEKAKVVRGVILVENDGESDSVEELVYEGGEYNDDDGMTDIGKSVAKKLQNIQRTNSTFIRPLEEGAEGRKLPGRRGRPPGTKSQLRPKPTKSVSQGNHVPTSFLATSQRLPPLSTMLLLCFFTVSFDFLRLMRCRQFLI
jgi:hypothetical protein